MPGDMLLHWRFALGWFGVVFGWGFVLWLFGGWCCCGLGLFFGRDLCCGCGFRWCFGGGIVLGLGLGLG